MNKASISLSTICALKLNDLQLLDASIHHQCVQLNLSNCYTELKLSSTESEKHEKQIIVIIVEITTLCIYCYLNFSCFVPKIYTRFSQWVLGSM